VNSFDKHDAVAIRKAQEAFNNKDVAQDLAYIEHFESIQRDSIPVLSCG
jgi:hypothetical protein